MSRIDLPESPVYNSSTDGRILSGHLDDYTILLRRHDYGDHWDDAPHMHHWWITHPESAASLATGTAPSQAIARAAAEATARAIHSQRWA